MKTQEPSWLDESRVEAKSIFQELEKKSLPRPMIRVSPKDVSEFKRLEILAPLGSWSHTGSASSLLHSLLEAYDKLPLVQETYRSLCKATFSSFSAKHQYEFQDGQVIYVPAGQEHDLNLTTVFDGEKSSQYLMIVLEKGASLSLVHFLKDACPGLRDLVLEIVVQEDASFTYTPVYELQGMLQLHRQAHVRGSCTVVDVTLEIPFIQVQSDMQLLIPGASARQTATICSNATRSFFSQQSHHQAPQTSSDIVTKAVLSNGAQSGLAGLVAMDNMSKDAQGYQQMDVLLLDEKSHASAIPELSIYTADVKCSHGATMGEIDEEELFYFQARGIPIYKAKQLIVQGFIQETLDHLDEEMQTMLLERLMSVLEE